MNARFFTIKLVGFKANETEQFNAILSLAERPLQHTWETVDSDQADFFCFADESMKASLFPEIPLSRCFFCDRDAALANHIRVDDNKVPALRSLVDVLNKAGSATQPSAEPAVQVIIPPICHESDSDTLAPVAPPTTTEERPPVPDSPPDFDFFSPDQGLLKILLENKTAPFLITCREISICIDPVQGFYYCPLTIRQLTPCLEQTHQPQVTSVSDSQLQQFIHEKQLTPQPLSNLVWYTAFKSSQGRLLQGSSPEDIVHLMRWPDLGLPECRNFVKLAAFMFSNTMKLAEIAERTQYPIASVYDFYNASYLVGLIEKSDVIQLHEKLTDPQRQNLLEKIRARLKSQIK